MISGYPHAWGHLHDSSRTFTARREVSGCFPAFKSLAGTAHITFFAGVITSKKRGQLGMVDIPLIKIEISGMVYECLWCWVYHMMVNVIEYLQQGPERATKWSLPAQNRFIVGSSKELHNIFQPLLTTRDWKVVIQHSPVAIAARTQKRHHGFLRWNWFDEASGVGMQ